MRWFAGMERKRTHFGRWIEERHLSQSEIAVLSGLSQKTINSLAIGETQRPTRLTARKLMKAIREIDPNATFEDFWG